VGEEVREVGVMDPDEELDEGLVRMLNKMARDQAAAEKGQITLEAFNTG
jgi:hypothetical protein